MIALALAFSLAAAGGPDDLDLPRTMSLDEFRFAAVEPEPAAPPPGFALFLAAHMGIAGAYDADNPAFVIGGGVRAHILSWLGADASIDFQTKQKITVGSANASVFQVPFQFAALFYPPLELPFRPYGAFGIGWTVTDITVPGPGNDVNDANLLFFLGFGAEFELTSNLVVTADLRFIFAQDPPRSGNFSADWIQFTLGLMLKLTR
jgi:outer membrane protein with beta-barrel domain